MTIDALNKLCKWRSVLAGWHTGSKALLKSDGTPTPGVAAMRDLMDRWLIIRAENNALAGLLIDKGVFTEQDFTAAVHAEAAALDKSLEERFPGFRTQPYGVEIYDLPLAQQTMARLGFPA
jgi:hypothetical protein